MSQYLCDVCGTQRNKRAEVKQCDAFGPVCPKLCCYEKCLDKWTKHPWPGSIGHHWFCPQHADLTTWLHPPYPSVGSRK